MTPKWQKLASLAQEICTLWFQFFGAVFASKGYPFKKIFHYKMFDRTRKEVLLDEVSSEKKLRVIFHSNLKFDEYINMAANKAYKMTGLIKRILNI